MTIAVSVRYILNSKWLQISTGDKKIHQEHFKLDLRTLITYKTFLC